jgi:hypothetical protein
MKHLSLFCFLLAFAGCHSAPASPLSAEFKKSSKFAYALLQQADQGQPVSKSEVSRALAEVQALAGNTDEQMVFQMLSKYRADLEYEAMVRPSAKDVDSKKQNQCELDKMFNEGLHGVDAMKACGEKLGT